LHVNGFRVHVEDVGVVATRQPEVGAGGFERGAEPGQIGLHDVAGAARRLVRPDQLGDPVGGHRLSGLEQQDGQGAPFLAPADRHQPPADLHLHRAEQPKLHGRSLYPPGARPGDPAGSAVRRLPHEKGITRMGERRRETSR
jgi:hypothetical protein